MIYILHFLLRHRSVFLHCTMTVFSIFYLLLMLFTLRSTGDDAQQEGDNLE